MLSQNQTPSIWNHQQMTTVCTTSYNLWSQVQSFEHDHRLCCDQICSYNHPRLPRSTRFVSDLSAIRLILWWYIGRNMVASPVWLGLNWTENCSAATYRQVANFDNLHLRSAVNWLAKMSRLILLAWLHAFRDSVGLYDLRASCGTL